MWRNSPRHYGALTIALHWLMALTIYGMFALGIWMVGLGYYDGWYHSAPEIHKGIGILLFAALLLRLCWRVISPPPAPLDSYSPHVRRAAHAAHWLLYGLLLVLLISGYLISTADGKPVSVFGWFEVPALFTGAGEQADVAGEVHLWLAWALVLLSALHALAALKHHFVDRDMTLKRMLGYRIPLTSEKEQ
ncbi:cytochrome b [Pantoea dispersa]|uniref:cytochrome b n=1 Tax=Pantoea dispersa TaxID=59814 RepID=UPI000F6731C7|nr:cytochrome b [Pantoea dispersa]RRW76097.1 cytochrome b [Pantoea dispersa]